MIQRFKVIVSDAAAAVFTEAEAHDIVRNTVPLAMEKDQGIHEGLVFNFEAHGQAWATLVDLQQGWAKIMREDEPEKGMADAIQAN
jgi:hypothetical protein